MQAHRCAEHLQILQSNHHCYDRPTVVPSLMKVTVVATEPVEVQVRVEDEDPWVNTRGLLMVGTAAGRDRPTEKLIASTWHCMQVNNGYVHTSMVPVGRVWGTGQTGFLVMFACACTWVSFTLYTSPGPQGVQNRVPHRILLGSLRANPAECFPLL